MEAYVCSSCGRLEFYNPRVGMATPTTGIFLPSPSTGSISTPATTGVAAPPAEMPVVLADHDELARIDSDYVEGEIRRRTRVRWVAAAGAGVGAGFIAFAVLDWPAATHVTNQIPIGIGACLAGICLAADFLLGRTFQHQITSIRTDSEGIRAVRRDGTTLVAKWDDPTFALDCVTRSRPERVPSASYLLMWPKDRWASAGELSAPGRTWLLAAAKEHGLTVTERNLGSWPSAMQLHELRAAGREPETKGAAVRPSPKLG